MMVLQNLLRPLVLLKSNMLYEYKFLAALSKTVGLELIVLFPLVRYLYKISSKTIANHRLFLVGTLCSFATLPYVWFVIPIFFKSHTLYVTAAEIFAVSIETIIYKICFKQNLKRSFVLSLACNAVSFGIGLLI